MVVVEGIANNPFPTYKPPIKIPIFKAGDILVKRNKEFPFQKPYRVNPCTIIELPEECLYRMTYNNLWDIKSVASSYLEYTLSQ